MANLLSPTYNHGLITLYQEGSVSKLNVEDSSLHFKDLLLRRCTNSVAPNDSCKF